MTNNRIELLAPAGDLEKLHMAVYYGADAVYFGGEIGGLRAGAGNLTLDEIREAMDFLHTNGCKGYLTMNIYPHNQDLPVLEPYLRKLKDIPVDAYLVSDPGMITLIQEIDPDREIHLSTQANTTNYRSAQFWAAQGIRRIVAAREMSLEEIREMREHLPDDVEIEAFVHGAMCISYSGRCLLSNYMAGRDANKGACTHPCRWKYHLVEEQRPGEYYPVEEDDRGTYIMNSRDLCMLDCLPDMINAGITSFKIEGRMKSSYYVATVVAAYRTALDAWMADPDHYEYQESWFRELCKASHRDFTHGFFYHKPTASDQNYLSSDYTREYSFVGLVRGYDESRKMVIVEQSNKFCTGDTVEIFSPREPYREWTITSMMNGEGEPIESAPHPQQTVLIPSDQPVTINSILRKRK